MRLVVKLNPLTAAALESSAPAAGALQSVCNELGISLTPMHPGVSSQDLKTYFTANVPDARVSEVQQQLMKTEGVEAAYIKPADSLP